jgi:hypothetical protein
MKKNVSDKYILASTYSDLGAQVGVKLLKSFVGERRISRVKGRLGWGARGYNLQVRPGGHLYLQDASVKLQTWLRVISSSGHQYL